MRRFPETGDRKKQKPPPRTDRKKGQSQTGMRYLLRYMKPYRKEAVIAPLLKFLEACMEIFVPLIMSQIIDEGIGKQDRAYILKMGGLLVFIALLGWGFAVTAQYFAAKAAMGFGAEVRNALFDRILGMEQERIDRIGIPSLITRVTNDVNRLQAGVNLVLRIALRAPFIVLGAILMSGVIDRRILPVFLAAAAGVTLMMFLVIRFSSSFYRKIQSLIDGAALLCRENLIGIRSVRAFRMQEKECGRFRGKTEELYRMQSRAGRISALLTPGNTVILNAAVILVLWLGGRLVNDGVLLNGKIIALVNYLTQILVAVTAFADLAVSVNKAVASAARLETVLAGPAEKSAHEAPRQEESSGRHPEKDGDPEAPVPFIEFRNVSFTYDGAKKPSLQDISFSVRRGARVGIIGGTGSGKSTVAALLQGIYPASEGRILINGTDILSYPDEERRALFAVCPQRVRLFEGTVRENLGWGKENATEEEMREALAKASALDFVTEKEGGLLAAVEPGGRNFSGGQKQRLTIARALLKDSPILILDDSTSALDFLTEAGIRHALAEETGKGRTAVIISQRTSGVSGCDLILVLEEGTLCGIGTHDELLASCTVYREIYQSQMGNAGEVK